MNPSRPLVLDGAIGTELARRGHSTSGQMWSARVLADAPRALTELHLDYLRSGADIITANTFRTNPRSFLAGGLTRPDARRATDAAVACAREAVAQVASGARVAGAIAPLEDCYRPDLVPAADQLTSEHGVLSGWLRDAGADLILVETMNTVVEAAAACRAAVETRLPVWVSFHVDSSGLLLSGETLSAAARAVDSLGVEAIGVNCVDARCARPLLDVLTRSTDRPALVYANGGRLVAGEWQPDPTLDALSFGQLAGDWLGAGAQIVGGCCGTGPDHIAAVRRVVDNWCHPA